MARTADQTRAVLAKDREEDGRRWGARLYVGSSEAMPEVGDESVTLTVTSPPYWNAIDYDRHAVDTAASYRTRAYASGFGDYVSYLEWVSGIFEETLRKTRPGGYLAVVIGTVLLAGAQYPVPFDLVGRLTARGWLFHQDIVWHKTTAGVKRAGVFIQHPYPGYFHPNIMTEYILVFRKPGEPIYRRAAEAGRREAENRIGALFTNEIANNVWHIAPVPPRTLDHPCPFPEEIPHRLVNLYSYPGDTVLDPFLGSGQTTKVAFAARRNAVGFDTIEKYVRYAHERLAEPPGIRPMQLVAEFAKVAIDAPLGTLGRTRQAGRTRHGSGLAGRPAEEDMPSPGGVRPAAAAGEAGSAAAPRRGADARSRSIASHLRWVAEVVTRFEGGGADRQELTAIGTLGLVRGVESFLPGRGLRLKEHALRCIEDEILRHLERRGRAGGAASPPTRGRTDAAEPGRAGKGRARRAL